MGGTSVMHSEGTRATTFGPVTEYEERRTCGPGVSSEDLQCPICVEPLRDAFVTSCGHTFCYPCISTHLKHRRNCPSCSTYLTTEHIYPNFLLNKIVSKAAAAAAPWTSSLARNIEQVLQAAGPHVSGRELDAAILALQSARSQLVHHEATSGLHLLLLLLQDARRRKQVAAAELKSQLEVLERDMTAVAQQQPQAGAGLRPQGGYQQQQQPGGAPRPGQQATAELLVSAMPKSVGELEVRLQKAAASALAGGGTLHVHTLEGGQLSSLSIPAGQLALLNTAQLAAALQAVSGTAPSTGAAAGPSGVAGTAQPLALGAAAGDTAAGPSSSGQVGKVLVVPGAAAAIQQQRAEQAAPTADGGSTPAGGKGVLQQAGSAQERDVGSAQPAQPLAHLVLYPPGEEQRGTAAPSGLPGARGGGGPSGSLQRLVLGRGRAHRADMEEEDAGAGTPTSLCCVRGQLDRHVSNHLNQLTEEEQGNRAHAVVPGGFGPAAAGGSAQGGTQANAAQGQAWDGAKSGQGAGKTMLAASAGVQQPRPAVARVSGVSDAVVAAHPQAAFVIAAAASDALQSGPVLPTSTPAGVQASVQAAPMPTPSAPTSQMQTSQAHPSAAAAALPVQAAPAPASAAPSWPAQAVAAEASGSTVPAPQLHRTSSRSLLGVRSASMSGATDQDPSLTALRAAKKRLILTQFEDLQKCYLTLRTGDSFQQVLSGATTFSRMLSVAEIPRAAQGGPISALARAAPARQPASGRASSANFVSCIDFDVTEQVFATCSPQRVSLWRYADVVSSPADQQVAQGQLNSRTKLTGLAFGRHQAHLLACSDSEGQVCLYDTSTLQMVLDVEAHDSRVWALDFAPGTADAAAAGQAHCLASGSDDYTVRVWDVRDGKPSSTIDTRGNVCSVRYNPWDAHYLAVGSAGHAVLVYDLRKAGGATPPLVSLAGHSKAVSYVRWAGRGELVSASTDSSLRLWDLQGAGGAAAGAVGAGGGACVRSYGGHVNERNFVGLSVDRDLIAAGSETNEVVIYYKPLSSPGIRHPLSAAPPGSSSSAAGAKGSQPFISCLAWRCQDRNLVAASSQGSVWVLSLQQ